MFNFGQVSTTIVRRTYPTPGRQPIVRRTGTVRRIRRVLTRGGSYRMMTRQMRMRRPTVVTGRGRMGNPCLLNGRVGAYIPGITLNRQVGLRPPIIWRGI